MKKSKLEIKINEIIKKFQRISLIPENAKEQEVEKLKTRIKKILQEKY